VRARLAIAEALDGPVRRLWGASAASAFLNFDLMSKGTPLCKERGRALALLASTLEEAGDAAPPALVARALSTWVVGAVHQYTSCQQAASAEQAAEVARALVTLRALVDTVPARAAGPTRTHLEALLVYLEVGGALLLDQRRPLWKTVGGIAPLVDRARAYQGLGPLPPRLVAGTTLGSFSGLR
jgi:hypothetical protein